jgi:hypothetical protein
VKAQHTHAHKAYCLVESFWLTLKRISERFLPVLSSIVVQTPEGAFAKETDAQHITSLISYELIF